MNSLAYNQEKTYTYADYLTWPEGRWELIEGIVYDMTPAPGRLHQEISGELFFQIRGALQNHNCKVYAAPFDVRLPSHALSTDDAIDTVVQPDIVVVCDKNKLDDRGCTGTPDLIIEILSPSTAAHDLKEKRKLYETHGVAEYWLVHPTDKIAMIYRLDENDQYNKAEIFTKKDKVQSKIINDLVIDLNNIFN